MNKNKLHELVDALPEDEIQAAQRFLEFLLEQENQRRFANAFENAPEEAQDISPEEMKAIEEGEKDLRAGRVKSFDRVMKALGA
ncbi:MAG: hypothetical protein Q9P90_08620 [candidate division KSB1 bacterium]|nr:hypothetical protein [candidate division KSB1 bacterium]